MQYKYKNFINIIIYNNNIIRIRIQVIFSICYVIIPAIGGESKKSPLFTYNNHTTTLEIEYNNSLNHEIEKNNNTTDAII